MIERRAARTIVPDSIISIAWIEHKQKGSSLGENEVTAAVGLMENE
jgi:hypothetical protein